MRIFISVALAIVLSASASGLSPSLAAAQGVFINELHYDNVGTDEGEAIEVAGAPGTDLTGWSLVLYNGSNGAQYDEVALTGTLTEDCSEPEVGVTFVSFPSNGIQNGSPDGVALVDPAGNVREFLSYEGSFVAVGGPADGLSSTDIGVSESGSTPVGDSLQLSVTGWVAAPGTFGLCNANQVAPSAPTAFINELHYDNVGTDEGEAIEVAGAVGTDLTGWSLVLYNGSNGAQYDEVALAGRLTASCTEPEVGVTFVSFPSNGIQNGSPDGIALVDASGAVVQLLSYEGNFVPVDGPAAGQLSIDIGASESSSTPVGSSLQLGSTGWTAGPSNFGSCNPDQVPASTPGEPDSASIRGRKWIDSNGNEARDPGEPGLPGVTIYLDLNQNGELDPDEPSTLSRMDDSSTSTADESGLFWFEDLQPGTYVVREVVPDGFTQTFPPSGEHRVELESGEVAEDLDFGNQMIEPGAINGRKWHDSNGDGARDPGEPGLPGVTIYSDLNRNGVFDPDEPFTLTLADDSTTPADESGLFWFEDLQPGTYVVREVVPDGFTQTFPPSGEHRVELGSGEVAEGLDFGNQMIEPGAINGLKWLDSDGNGARDPDEPGLAGVTIYLDLNHNGALDPDEPSTLTMMDDSTTAADESGLFWFTDLQPGTYVVREVVPDGFTQTFPPSGEHRVELGSGEVAEGLDFGNAFSARRVSLCHKGRVITVDYRSVPAHLRHRDRLVYDVDSCEADGD